MLQFTGNLPPIIDMQELPFYGAKIALFGSTGTGKTRSVMSCPKPCLYMTSENKYASVTDMSGIKFIKLECFQQFVDSIIAFTEKSQNPNFPIKTIFIDSLTDIAEKRILELKPIYKDIRQAYGLVLDEIIEILTYIKNIKCNVVIVFKMEYTQDIEGNMLFGPMIPGKKLGQNIPYEFDEIFCAISRRDGDKIKHYFQTINDGRYACKSCSSVLPEYIEQDFSMIFNMIMSRYEHFGKPKEPNESENQNIAY